MNIKTAIERYNKARKELEEAGEEMYIFFDNIIDIQNIKTTVQALEAKERLREMPYSPEKVLLFRKIIIKQNEIESKK